MSTTQIQPIILDSGSTKSLKNTSRKMQNHFQEKTQYQYLKQGGNEQTTYRKTLEVRQDL